jgi:hypothetical protein
VHALRRRWYGDRTIEWACSDGPLSPFGRCDTGERVLLLNGSPVATANSIYVLGFVER